MDQGFAPEGFKAPSIRVTPSRAPQVPAGRPIESGVKRAESQTPAEFTKAPELTPEQKNIKNFRAAEGALTSPFQMEFMGMMAAGGGTWVAKKTNWTRGNVAINAIFTAPFQALRETRLHNLFSLPARYTAALEKITNNAGGLAKDKWAASLGTATTGLLEKSDAINGRVNSFVQPHLHEAGKLIDAAEKTKIGQQVHGAIDYLATARKGQVNLKYDAQLGKVGSALTQEAVGFRQGVVNFFTRRKPGLVAVGEHLAPAQTLIQQAQALTGEARVLKLGEAHGLLQGVLETTEGEVAKRAAQVSKQLTKALGSANAVHFYESAAGSTLKGFVGKGAQALGKIPVFNLLVGAGVVAGLGATVLTANMQSKEAKLSYKGLASDLGGANSDYLQAVKKAYKKDGIGRMAKTGMQLVGDVANAGFMLLPGGGGAALMGGAVLPQLGQMFVQDNPVLNAFQGLKQYEEGKLTISPAQKLYFTKELIAVAPSVAANGGMFNRLTTPIAESFLKQNLTTAQIVQTIADAPRFNKVATEANEQMKAEAAKAAANDDAKLAPSANENAPHVGPTAAEQAYAAAEKPALPTGNGKVNAGTVVAAERLRA